MEQFTYPEVRYRLPNLVSPTLDEAEKLVAVWLTEIGLAQYGGQAEDRNKFTYYLSHAYPYCTDIGRMYFIAKACYVNIITDDLLIEYPRAHGRPTESVRNAARLMAIGDDPFGAPDYDEPILRAWRDVCLHAHELGGWRLNLQTTLGMEQFLLGLVMEIPYVIEHGLPDAATYRTFRVRTTGFYLWFEYYVTVAANRAFPPEAFAHYKIRRIMTSSSRLCGLANDIWHLGDEPDPARSFALPAVIAREQGCSIQEGIQRATEIYDRDWDELLALRAELMADADADIRFLAQWIPQLPQAFLSWMGPTQRYSDPVRYTGEEFISGGS
jgi:hypothetical protein